MWLLVVKIGQMSCSVKTMGTKLVSNQGQLQAKYVPHQHTKYFTKYYALPDTAQHPLVCNSSTLYHIDTWLNWSMYWRQKGQRGGSGFSLQSWLAQWTHLQSMYLMRHAEQQS